MNGRSSSRAASGRTSEGEVATTWHAKQAIQELYVHTDEPTSRRWIASLVRDMADAADDPIPVRSLGRSLPHRKDPIVARHRSHVSNGVSEAANNSRKR